MTAPLRFLLLTLLGLLAMCMLLAHLAELAQE